MKKSTPKERSPRKQTLSACPECGKIPHSAMHDPFHEGKLEDCDCYSGDECFFRRTAAQWENIVQWMHENEGEAQIVLEKYLA